VFKSDNFGAASILTFEFPSATRPSPKVRAHLFHNHLLWLAGAAMICGLALWLLSGRFVPNVFGSLGLLVVLVGFFVLFVVFVPQASSSHWLAVLCFKVSPGGAKCL
jgi:hypothetical protein